ncbi:hypothetical protein WS66_11610 [Burkholderia sp. LA-2-3-30-S1-D2]|nr:hypothetical protein WS66_11610 [Burkholderia sp. LA-2-3-30-S1-D2]KVE11268.1 hypothetical protein WS66_20780 [Burkholderia sp. LA-2-3-30-S1-D2]
MATERFRRNLKLIYRTSTRSTVSIAAERDTTTGKIVRFVTAKSSLNDDSQTGSISASMKLSSVLDATGAVTGEEMPACNLDE